MVGFKRFAFKLSETYKQANFAFVISLALSIIVLFNFVQNIQSIFWLYLTVVFFVTTFLQGLIVTLLKRDLVNYGEAKKVVRVLSCFQLLGLVVGNVFTVASAFSIVKKKISIEYTMAYYALITTSIMLFVSSLNMYKPFVSNTFLGGMTLLFFVWLINLVLLIAMYRVGIHTKSHFLLAIISIIGLATGNIFNLILSISLFIKTTKQHPSTIDKWNNIWFKIIKNFTAMSGLLFICCTFGISIMSLMTFEYDFAVENDYSNMLQKPSIQYPFGTDNFGRDVFSRIIYGARISLIVGILSTLIPMIIGGILGSLSGYYSKYVDNIIMRILDVLYAIPGILLAIAIISAFGANTTNLIIALSVGSIPTYARTMRANVLMLSNLEFVEASRALGEGDRYIIFKQIVPNALAPMIVKATLTIGGAIIATSSLSFLGLGVGPHIPEWGNILKVGSMYLETNPYLAIYPGIAIILLVLSFNFLGDALRDAFDPKLN